jgi:hypothetical protein
MGKYVIVLALCLSLVPLLGGCAVEVTPAPYGYYSPYPYRYYRPRYRYYSPYPYWWYYPFPYWG